MKLVTYYCSTPTFTIVIYRLRLHTTGAFKQDLQQATWPVYSLISLKLLLFIIGNLDVKKKFHKPVKKFDLGFS